MRKYLFIFIAFIALYSCKNESEKINIPPSSDETLGFARRMFGENVTLLIRGDINSNGMPDALAAVINKQVGEMKFWIQRGGVIEKTEDGWKLILRIDERISSSKSILNEIPESRNGYILNFSMEQNPVKLRLSASNAQGQPVSEEFALKWDELNNTYEIEKK